MEMGENLGAAGQRAQLAQRPVLQMACTVSFPLLLSWSAAVPGARKLPDFP